LIFKNMVCVIEDPSGHEVFKVKMEGRCFSLNPLEEEKMTFLISDNSIEVWCKRIGHFHHQGMMLMDKKKLVNDLPFIQNR